MGYMFPAVVPFPAAPLSFAWPIRDLIRYVYGRILDPSPPPDPRTDANEEELFFPSSSSMSHTSRWVPLRVHLCICCNAIFCFHLW